MSSQPTNDTEERVRQDMDALSRQHILPWHFQAGPVGVSARLSSMRLAQLLVLLYLVITATGVVLITMGGAPRDIGIALVVGAVFASGAFLAQVWTLQVERERWVTEERLRADIAALWKRLDEIDDSDPTTS